MTFRAVRADKTDAGQTVRFVDMDEAELMDGDVTVRVTHSTVNYKDGLTLSGKSAVIRRFPMVLGIDLAGVVETSSRPDFAPGDEVILNGHGLSETHFGGYAEKARVNGDWLIKLPAGLTRADAMAIGTAGYTAMLALMAIEREGLTPSSGPALVTGAAGGVGSTAISLFVGKGWKVIASTGRASEAEYLKAPRRGRDHRPRDAQRPRQAARQGAMGGGGRQRRLDDARQRARADPIRRRGRGLRPRGRHGLADDGRAVHPARRHARRHRQRQLPHAAPARGLAAARGRTRSRQARRDDARPFPLIGVRRRGAHT